MKPLVETLPSLFRGFTHAAGNWTAAIQDCIKQLSYLKFDADTDLAPGTGKVPSIKLGPLLALDPAEADRLYGVCSVPLYEFTNEQAEIFKRGKETEHAADILTKVQIRQFFFPAPDHLALGLVEGEKVTPHTLLEHLKQAPALGHPFGSAEIITTRANFPEIVDVLIERKLCIEGEVSLELTPEGKAERVAVRFKPREGTFERLSRLISIKVDMTLKDIAGLFGKH